MEVKEVGYDLHFLDGLTAGHTLHLAVLSCTHMSCFKVKINQKSFHCPDWDWNPIHMRNNLICLLFCCHFSSSWKKRQVLFSQETYTGYIVQVGNTLNLIEFPLEKQKLHWKVAEFCHTLKVKKKTVVGALQKAKAVVYPKPNHIPWWNMIQRVIEKLMGRGYV